MVLGIVFIALVAFWTLFLVVLPYLYMVQESFHPTLAADEARRTGGCPDHRAIPVLLRGADRRWLEHHPYGRVRLLDHRLDRR